VKDEEEDKRWRQGAGQCLQRRSPFHIHTMPFLFTLLITIITLCRSPPSSSSSSSSSFSSLPLPLLPVFGQSLAPDPTPNPPFGIQSPYYWPAGSYSSPAYNPFASSCTAGVANVTYMNGLENYQQPITFIPNACVPAYTVIITTLPDPSDGVLYEYSYSDGRSYPVVANTPISGNMVLFQPAVHAFSVFDYASGINATRNASLATIQYQINDTTTGTLRPTVPASVEFWILWQNQPPEIRDAIIDSNTGEANYTNQIITLHVQDPDVQAGVDQTLTAYIAQLPNAGNLYQYDESAPQKRGSPITMAPTALWDASFRVVLEVLGTGRPYATFEYYADDYTVQSLTSGRITVNILVQETPQSKDANVTVAQNGQVVFQLPANSTAATMTLNRAIVTTLPQRGSLFQVLADGGIGQRLQIVPSRVQHPDRQIAFKPDPFTTSDGLEYASFEFKIDNGLAESGVSTIKLFVTTVHLPPEATSFTVKSLYGNDAQVPFIASTQEPNAGALTAVIMSLPTLGTLKQSDGTPITSVPCNVTDMSLLTVTYTPYIDPANPSVTQRYSESFLYAIFDQFVLSANATVSIEVGTPIRPPLVFPANYTTTQDTSIVIQLQGEVQDDSARWTATIATLPQQGKFYQMQNGLKGDEITGVATVDDPNFYIWFDPDRFSAQYLTFQFYGQVSNIQGFVAVSDVATCNITVGPVPYAPVVTNVEVSTPASTQVLIPLKYYVGPDPRLTVQVFLKSLPAAGQLFQWNSTTQTKSSPNNITQADIDAAIAGGDPGLLVTDPGLDAPDDGQVGPLKYVLFAPPPYVNGDPALGYAFGQFEFIARDQGLVSPSSALAKIAVTKRDFAPIAYDADLTMLQEGSLVIYLASYVFHPSASNGNTFVCQIASLPTRGTLYQVDASGARGAVIPVPGLSVLDPLQRVIYKPLANQWGQPFDSFQYFAEDPATHLKSIRTPYPTIHINVTHVNKPPIASNVDAWLKENQAKIIQLNPLDPEGSNCTTTLTAINLPRGTLFQFVPAGGSLPSEYAAMKLTVGGDAKDEESVYGYTYANYTGTYGGGFDHTQFLGAPINASYLPINVTDPLNRVVFLPREYDHGNAAYDSIYGDPQLPGQGTFKYSAYDGLDASTTAGIVTIHVVAVEYAPIALNMTVDVLEDSPYNNITLSVINFHPDDPTPCTIISLPDKGALFHYDASRQPLPYNQQIVTDNTAVQDIKADGSPGDNLIVVYKPPVLEYGQHFTTFTFVANNGKVSNVGTVTINVNKINHPPRAKDSYVALTGHNTTVVVPFEVEEVDYDAPLYITITEMGDKGALWLQYTTYVDTSPNGFNRWMYVPGTRLTVGSTYEIPPPAWYTTPNITVNGSVVPAPRFQQQTFTLLFDDAGQGGGAVESGCVKEGSDGSRIPCGYTWFKFTISDPRGEPSSTSAEHFVQVGIQCGPSYVVNTWDSVGDVCIHCPIGAICPTEGQFTPLAEPGYWRAPTSTGLMFVLCDPEDACRGTWNQSAAVTDLDSQCAAGYYGRLCAACEDGYYKLNNECNPCPDTSIFWVVMVGVPVVILSMFFVMYISRRSVDLTFFIIVLTYCQTLAIFANYHMTWPDSVMMTLTVFSITHLNLDIFAVSCYYDAGTYSSKWKSKMSVIPGLALGVVLLVLLLIANRAMLKKMCPGLEARWMGSERRRHKKNDAFNTKTDENGVETLATDETGEEGESRQTANRADHTMDSHSSEHRKPVDRRSSGLANHTRHELARQAAFAAGLEVAAGPVSTNHDPSLGFTSATSMSQWSTFYVSVGFRTFTLLLFVAYFPIVSKAFQLFTCTAFPDGTSTFDADPSLTCYAPWWDDLYPWGILAVIVYGLGAPAWFLYGIKKTHPPFEMVQYWWFLYYPRVISKQRQAKEAAMRRKLKLLSPSIAAVRFSPATALMQRRASGPGIEMTSPIKKASNNHDATKDPPPGTNDPPAIPAPADDLTAGKLTVTTTTTPLATPAAKLDDATGSGSGSGSNAQQDRDVAPHLHAATVSALKQAAVSGGATEDEALEREYEQQTEAAREAKRAGWARSDNLALTDADSKTLNEKQKIARFMFTLTIDPFRDDMFFWMLPILFRSFLLALVSIFFADEPVYQATLALLVLFVYTLATSYFQPFVNPQMNKLDFFCMTCSCLVLFMGFLFVGEADRSSPVFKTLEALCLLIIIVSFLAIGRAVVRKLEEVFHCWSCRRVPAVGVPSNEKMDEIAIGMRGEIIGAHKASMMARELAESKRKEQKPVPSPSNVGSSRGRTRAGPNRSSPSNQLSSPSGQPRSDGLSPNANKSMLRVHRPTKSIGAVPSVSGATLPAPLAKPPPPVVTASVLTPSSRLSPAAQGVSVAAEAPRSRANSRAEANKNGSEMEHESDSALTPNRASANRASANHSPNRSPNRSPRLAPPPAASASAAAPAASVSSGSPASNSKPGLAAMKSVGSSSARSFRPPPSANGDGTTGAGGLQRTMTMRHTNEKPSTMPSNAIGTMNGPRNAHAQLNSPSALASPSQPVIASPSNVTPSPAHGAGSVSSSSSSASSVSPLVSPSGPSVASIPTSVINTSGSTLSSVAAHASPTPVRVHVPLMHHRVVTVRRTDSPSTPMHATAHAATDAANTSSPSNSSHSVSAPAPHVHATSPSISDMTEANQPTN